MSAARTADAGTVDAVVDIRCAAWRTAVPRAAALCRRAAAAAIDGSGAAGARTEIGIVLADDGLVRSLNRDWRGIDSPTNVLAFPCDGDARADGPPALLGDVVIAYGTASHEAARDGRRVADHLAHLVVHGVLHLLGHDHGTDRDAERMEALETRILDGLGIADPFADGPAGGGPVP